MSDNKFYYKVPDKPLYNIQEQVYVNQYKIEENRRLIDLHYETDRVIAELGIRIIGQRDTYEEIQDIIPEQFGDAYAIGPQPPYDYYVWTRIANNTPVEEGEWFNIGLIAIQGEPGPMPIIENDGTYITSTNPETGDTTNVIAISELKGADGISTQWATVLNNLPNANTYAEGDMLLKASDGTVYKCTKKADGTKQWAYIMSIIGPQGVQGAQGPAGPAGEPGPAGEKGPQGDVGGFINIWGILPSTPLPPPSTLNNLTVAYLVGHSAPYDLYVQVGETSATAQWQNTGPFNAATVVSVGGVFQNTWNADTKLDKVTGVTQANQVYVKTSAGNQEMWSVVSDIANNAVVRRTGNGDILVNDVPVSPYGAVNKNYTSNTFVAKPTTTGLVRFNAADGTASTYGVYQSVPADQQVPLSKTGGRITTNAPEEALDCANKQYVDDTFVKKVTTTSTYNRVYYVPNGGTDTEVLPLQYPSNFQNQADAESRGGIPAYINGKISCADPETGFHVANKRYVDDAISNIHGRQYYAIYSQFCDYTEDNEQSWNDVQFTFSSNVGFTGNRIPEAALADMLFAGGYNTKDTGALVTYSKSNGYTISGPLLTIWSPDGATIHAYSPGQVDTFQITFGANPYITKCKH